MKHSVGPASKWARHGQAPCEIASAPLKVCLVVPLPPPYGGIGHWAQLICGQAAARKDMKLYVVDISPRWRELHDMRVWRRVVFGGFHMLGDVCRVLRALIGGCRVIHLTTPGQLAVYRDLVILALARVFRVPVLYHIRFGRIPELARLQTREGRRYFLAMRYAHTVISIDRATEETIRRQLPHVRVISMPNCVDLATLPTPSVQRGQLPTVMYLGWILPTKGIEELVRAWSELAPVGWQLQLIGPGDPAYQKKLLEQYRPKNLVFLGEKPHPEAMQLMADADVFVLPSYTEGFPNVIVEAMAIGKAIIATSVGAIPEMLGGDCGIVVPPRQVEPLKDALTCVMADLTLRQRIGVNAKERAHASYSLPTVFGRLVELWRSAATEQDAKSVASVKEPV